MPLTARHPSQALVDLVGTLGGTWHGRTAMCLCPSHADTTPSLSLRQGDRGILVTCFAGCQREDVLRELSRIKTIGHHHYAPPANNRPGNVERLWETAQPVRGTLAEHYLASRHLLPTADDLRFHPRCPVRPKPWTTFHPALLVPVRERLQLTAVQRIVLDPATGDYRAKLMLGRPAHGAWRGAEEGEGTLALAEGFESAQAFTILNGIPCWATLGARRYDQIRLPANVSHLLLAADNDAEGRRAVDKAIAAYSRLDLRVTPMAPERLKDWADVLAANMKDPAHADVKY